MFKNLKIFDNRILILYIIQTTSADLQLNQIASICSDFDDVTYFDVCEYVQNLIFNGYIYSIESQDFNGEDETYSIYKLTKLGETTLKELLELVPGVDLFKLKTIVNEKVSNNKNKSLNLSVGTKILPLKNDDFKVSCYIKEDNADLINISLYGSNKDETANIVKNWENNYMDVYNNIIEKMTNKTQIQKNDIGTLSIEPSTRLTP